MCSDGFGGRRGKDAELERLLKGGLEKCDLLDNASECFIVMRRTFDSALDLGFMANHVLAYLMHIADVLTLTPTAEGGDISICCPSAQEALQQLAVRYMKEQDAVQGAGLSVPVVVPRSMPSLHLKFPVDSLDADAELLLLDNSADVQRKIKRAFCEPGNVDNCPPLQLVVSIILPCSESKQLLVRRRAEDGGDLSLTDGAGLRDLYASGGLHPGDFKPALRDAVDEVLKRVRAAINADKQLGAAEKELQKVAKRSASKGGSSKSKK